MMPALLHFGPRHGVGFVLCTIGLFFGDGAGLVLLALGCLVIAVTAELAR